MHVSRKETNLRNHAKFEGDSLEGGDWDGCWQCGQKYGLDFYRDNKLSKCAECVQAYTHYLKARTNQLPRPNAKPHISVSNIMGSTLLEHKAYRSAPSLHARFHVHRDHALLVVRLRHSEGITALHPVLQPPGVDAHHDPTHTEQQDYGEQGRGRIQARLVSTDLGACSFSSWTADALQSALTKARSY